MIYDPILFYLVALMSQVNNLTSFFYQLKEVTDQKEKLNEEKANLETLSSELQKKLTQKEEELKSTAQKLEKEKVSHVCM